VISSIGVLRSAHIDRSCVSFDPWVFALQSSPPPSGPVGRRQRSDGRRTASVARAVGPNHEEHGVHCDLQPFRRPTALRPMAVRRRPAGQGLASDRSRMAVDASIEAVVESSDASERPTDRGRRHTSPRIGQYGRGASCKRHAISSGNRPTAYEAQRKSVRWNGLNPMTLARSPPRMATALTPNRWSRGIRRSRICTDLQSFAPWLCKSC